MRLEPSLFQRGLIIIALPLVCQVALLAYLFSVLNSIQEIRDHEKASYQLLRDTYDCFRRSTEEIVTTTLVRSMREEVNQVEKRRQMEILIANSKKLADQIEANPRQKRNAIELRKATEKLSGAVKGAFPVTYADDWNTSQYTVKRKPLEEATIDYLAVLKRIVKIEEKYNTIDDRKTKDAIGKLDFIFIFAVVGSLVLAAYLARYYAVSISKPLKHLSGSAELLAEMKTLPTRLESSSLEFSQVDSLLHLVSNEVEGALNREREVIANAVELICSLDQNEVFQAVNPYVERMLGYTQDELIGCHLSELADVSELPDATEHMRSTMETGTRTTFELKLRRSNSTVINTKWYCVWSEAHQMFFCIVNDVTEQTRAEQLRIDFSETVSDDLRQPLLNIQRSLFNLIHASDETVSPEIAKTLTKTSKNVDRLILLANELLDFQKLRGGKMQLEPAPCDLSEIIGDAVDCIDILAEPKKIKITRPTGSYCLECDRTKILQVVVNLLSNAIKFSPVDSTIRIEARESSSTGLEFHVIDSGPGIPEDFQQRIFEPFEQVPGAQAKVGTGLGLAICKLVAEAHGGSISVSSIASPASGSKAPADASQRFKPPVKQPAENGTGSIFTVSLPKSPRMS